MDQNPFELSNNEFSRVTVNIKRDVPNSHNTLVLKHFLCLEDKEIFSHSIFLFFYLRCCTGRVFLYSFFFRSYLICRNGFIRHRNGWLIMMFYKDVRFGKLIFCLKLIVWKVSFSDFFFCVFVYNKLKLLWKNQQSP